MSMVAHFGRDFRPGLWVQGWKSWLLEPVELELEEVEMLWWGSETAIDRVESIRLLDASESSKDEVGCMWLLGGGKVTTFNDA